MSYLDEVKDALRKTKSDLSKLNEAKSSIDTMLDSVSRLYAALVDEQDILGRLDYALQDSNHNIKVDFQYYINKINDYVSIDYIPGLNDCSDLDILMYDDTCNTPLRDKFITSSEKYIDSIKSYGKEIDIYKEDCGTQTTSIINARNLVNGLITTCNYRIESLENIIASFESEGDD